MKKSSKPSGEKVSTKGANNSVSQNHSAAQKNSTKESMKK